MQRVIARSDLSQCWYIIPSVILQKLAIYSSEIVVADGVTTSKTSSGTNCCWFTRYCVRSTPTDASCSRWFDSASLVALSISEIDEKVLVRLFLWKWTQSLGARLHQGSASTQWFCCHYKEWSHLKMGCNSILQWLPCFQWEQNLKCHCSVDTDAWYKNKWYKKMCFWRTWLCGVQQNITIITTRIFKLCNLKILNVSFGYAKENLQYSIYYFTLKK